MDCTDLSIGAGMSIENVGTANSITICRIVLTFCSVNRFAGTRLEDLAGEISSLCKDQHGCRYLQKKLEEGVPEHRDMIFRETFGHFADLMTGKRFVVAQRAFIEIIFRSVR